MYFQKKADHAAMYLRISREDGDKAESDSIGGQRNLITKYAAEHDDITLTEEYVDDGYTGTNFDRPGFKRMIEDAGKKKIDCIIVKDLSRLGRNYIETGKYIEKIFPDLGIRFIAVTDNYDNKDNPDDEEQIVVPIKNLINDAYCRDISVKTRSQLDTKRKNGKFIGSFAVYGYRKDDKDKNHLIIDEYAAGVVRKIFRMKVDGMNSMTIADRLNDMGILPPAEYKRSSGLKYNNGFRSGENPVWFAATVDRILQNEIYTGTMVQGKRRKINYKVKQCQDVTNEDWIRVNDTHDPIIKEDVFHCVQEIMRQDTRTAPSQETVSLFSGVLCCGDCGQNMVRRCSVKKGKKYFYYHCSTYKNGDGCSSHIISEKNLTGIVLSAIRQQIDLLVEADDIISGIDHLPEQELNVKVFDDQLGALHQEEERYRDLKAKLYQDMVEGLVTRDEFVQINQRFTKKLENAKNRTEEIIKKRENLISGEGQSNLWLEEFKSCRNVGTLSREMLVRLVNRITVYSKDSVSIEFRYGSEMQDLLDYAAGIEKSAKRRTAQ